MGSLAYDYSKEYLLGKINIVIIYRIVLNSWLLWLQKEYIIWDKAIR